MIEEIPVFERFTDRSRRVVVRSQDEARKLNHHYVGTEHLLLGLVTKDDGEDDGGVAMAALTLLGIEHEKARDMVLKAIGRGGVGPSGHIPFTPRAKKVFELSLREALQLGHNWIGTEHIILGLIREGEGVAAQVLIELGADLSKVRQQVILVLSGSQQSVNEPQLSEFEQGYQAGVAHARQQFGIAFLDYWKTLDP